MPAHEEILRAAVDMCRRRGGWRFRPVEIVDALPHLDPGTVRTHIISRCCINAPKNHPHKWDYFRRVSRGLYEIHRRYRQKAARSRRSVAESPAVYGSKASAPVRDTVHAVITDSSGWYVGECLEIAVVTQGRTLDQLVSNLREAIALHLDDEDPAALGLVPSPRLAVTYELPSIAS